MNIGIDKKRPMLSLRFWDRSKGWDSSVTIDKSLKTPKDWTVEGYTVTGFAQKEAFNKVLLEHAEVAQKYMAEKPGASARDVKIYLESYIAEKESNGEKSTFIKFWYNWLVERNKARQDSTTKQKLINVELVIKFFASKEMAKYVTDVELKFDPKTNSYRKKYNIERPDGLYRKIKDVPMNSFSPKITKLVLLPKHFEDWYMKNNKATESTLIDKRYFLREGLTAAINNLKIPGDVVVFHNDNRETYEYNQSQDAGHKNIPDADLEAMKDLRPDGVLTETQTKYIHAFQFLLETGMSLNDMIRVKRWPCEKPQRHRKPGQYNKNYSVIEKFGDMNVLWGYRAKYGAGMFIQPLSDRAMEIWEWFQAGSYHYGSMETPMRVTPHASYFNTQVRNALAKCDTIDPKYSDHSEGGEGVSSKTGRHCKITRMVGYPAMLRSLVVGHNLDDDKDVNNTAKDHYIETKAQEIAEIQEIWGDIRDMLATKRKRDIFDKHYAQDAKQLAF